MVMESIIFTMTYFQEVLSSIGLDLCSLHWNFMSVERMITAMCILVTMVSYFLMTMDPATTKRHS